MPPNWISAGRPIAVLATVAVALLLAGIGRLAVRRVESGSAELSTPMTWLVMGWATASLVGALAAFFGVPLFWPSVCLGLSGIAGYIVGPPRLPLAWLVLGWLIVTPLLLIASTIPPMMSDEFGHWLPNTRFLVEYGRFPELATPNIWSGKPAYPPAIPVIGYGVQALIGRGWEIAAKLFSVLLAAGFGLILADLVRNRLGNVIAVVLGVTFATVLNPFFDPRLSLTAYADVPTGFVLAFLLYTGWQALEERGVSRFGPPIAAGVLLVMLRESNVPLVAGCAIGLALTGRRGRMLCIAITCASVAAFAVWRGYITAARMPPTLAPRPLAEWQWDAPWILARSLITERLANNKALGGAVLLLGAIAIAILVLRWRLFQPLRHLLLIFGTVAFLWIAFVLWSYIGVFIPEDVVRAASVWRYLSQLGPSVVMVCFAMLATTLPSAAPVGRARPSVPWALALAGCLSPGLLIIVTHSHWQIDLRYPLKRTMHSVATFIGPVIGNQPLAVIHPIDAAEVALEIDFDLHRPISSSEPLQALDQDRSGGLALDATGFENGRCPRLLRWGGSEWSDVTPAGLLDYCRTLNLS